mmetsp:Transcript_18323/g.52449  ORF Transcript_18323/g.52449 Transcript_18323/m.52449 type:complete len:208 (-) Transcript_18323:3021-3644(-)
MEGLGTLSGTRFVIELSMAFAFHADASARALLRAGRKSAASSATVLARELANALVSAEAARPSLERLDCKSKSVDPPFLGVFLDPAPRPLPALGSLRDRISRSYSSTWPCKTSMASVSILFSSFKLRISSDALPFLFFVGDLADASTPDAASICSSSDNLEFCNDISLDRDTRLFSNLATLFLATSSFDSLSIASESLVSIAWARSM